MGLLAWIIVGGVLMSALALVGGLTMLLDENTQRRMVRPLVAFAADSLLGGALLHMVPEAASRAGGGIAVLLWVLAGFSAFLALEQFLHRHSTTSSEDWRWERRFWPTSAWGSRPGWTAAAHEVPQELGDFARHREVKTNLVQARG